MRRIPPDGGIPQVWREFIAAIADRVFGAENRGDITFGDDGLPITLNDGAVTHAKLDLPQAALYLLDDESAADQRTTLGLGTIATQDADDVSITGGSATGMTSVESTTVKVTDKMVISKAAGDGIQINPDSPAFGWHDMIGNITVRNTGPTVPTFAVYRGSIRQHQCNAATTEFFNEFHIPHDYLPGSDLFIHIHWSQIVVDTGGTAGAPGDAKWNFEITYAKGHQQAAFVAPVTCSVVQTASGTQYQHMIAEVQMSAASPSASQIDSDNIEVDGIILVRAYRDGTDPADTLDQQPFVHFIDIHYQSTGITTKNRAPDFYT